MKDGYPIGAVSQLTGLGLDTLRAWERRYKAVEPRRGERGRVYSDADIRRLRLLRTLTEAGHAIGQIASLGDDTLERLSRATDKPPAREDGLDAGLFQELLDLVERFDSAALEVELRRLALLLTPSALVHTVILPLVRETGLRWERGALRAAHEHLLSGCVRSLLGALASRQDTRGTAGKILLTTPKGDYHEFGILAAALLAVGQHHQAVYLGPNLPAEEIVHAAGVVKPRLVVLAATPVTSRRQLREQVDQIASSLPPGIPLWVGGSGAQQLAGAEWSNVTLLADMLEYERLLDSLRP